MISVGKAIYSISPCGWSMRVTRMRSPERRTLPSTADEEVIRVDVMHPERAQEAPADDRHRLASPGVGGPVNEAGRQVGDQGRGDGDEWHPPAEQGARPCQPDHVDDEQRSRANQAHGFDRARRAPGVVESRQRNHPLRTAG